MANLNKEGPTSEYAYGLLARVEELSDKSNRALNFKSAEPAYSDAVNRLKVCTEKLGMTLNSSELENTFRP